MLYYLIIKEPTSLMTLNGDPIYLPKLATEIFLNWELVNDHPNVFTCKTIFNDSIIFEYVSILCQSRGNRKFLLTKSLDSKFIIKNSCET